MQARNPSLDKKKAGKRKRKQTVKERFNLNKRYIPEETTKLHVLLKKRCSTADLQEYLIYLNHKKKAITKTKTTDIKGKLPLASIPDALPPSDYMELYDELFDYTAANTLAPESELIDEEQVLQQFANVTNHQAHATMRMACRVVNQIKSYQLKSSTHPETNTSLDDDAMMKFDSFFSKVNRIVDSELAQWKRSSKNKELHDFAEVKHTNKFYRDDYGVANCHEYSYLVVEEIWKMDRDACVVEVIALTNSDHVFVVINRDTRSDINQPANWGQNAVICDAWAGKVYPACEFASNMSGFGLVRHPERQRQYNVTYFFNAAFHKMKVLLKFAFDAHLNEESDANKNLDHHSLSFMK